MVLKKASFLQAGSGSGSRRRNKFGSGSETLLHRMSHFTSWFVPNLYIFLYRRYPEKKFREFLLAEKTEYLREFPVGSSGPTSLRGSQVGGWKCEKFSSLFARQTGIGRFSLLHSINHSVEMKKKIENSYRYLVPAYWRPWKKVRYRTHWSSGALCWNLVFDREWS